MAENKEQHDPSDVEKTTNETVHLEHGADGKLISNAQLLDNFDPKLVKSVNRKVDWRLIPAVTAMYAVSLMDRNNLSNMVIAGMTVDLDIVTGYGYNLSNMSFFITYTIFAAAMVALCRKVGPRWFIPTICFLWGCVLVAGGWIQHWHHLLAVRLALGLLEAGFFPSTLYLITTWYTRFETATRLAIFYLVGNFFSGLSNILAYGLQQMEGTGGIRGWRWIMIMEGVITVAIAIYGFIFLIQFPDEELTKRSWHFLSDEHLNVVVERINADRADVQPEPFTWKRFFSPARDIYIFGFPWLLLLTTTVGYAFAFTLPIVLRETLGFTVAQSQCLTTPPVFVALVIGYFTARASDKYQVRGPVLMFYSLVSIIGLGLMGWVSNPWVKYFGVFVAVSGVQSSISAVISYQSTNIRGQWRRAFSSAAFTGLGGIGGVAGALIFRAQDRPGYIPGFIACLVAEILILITVTIMSLYFRRCNAQADRGERVLLEDPNFRFTI